MLAPCTATFDHRNPTEKGLNVKLVVTSSIDALVFVLPRYTVENTLKRRDPLENIYVHTNLLESRNI